MPSSQIAPGQWWRKPFGMLQTNLREIDASMDVDKVASFIKAYGADAWLIGVGGIQAQYPTKLSYQDPNPHLVERKSGDLVADAMVAARANGLRLLARMDFSKISSTAAAEHPDWCFMSPDGNLQEHTAGLVSVCPSGPFYQEKMFEIIDEITTNYQLDGFFFNWMSMNEIDYYKKYHGVCHCSNCHAKWHEFSGGKELPNGPSDKTYPEWVAFGEEVIDDVVGRVRAFIAAKLPDAGLILGSTADIMFHEANNSHGKELWHHATSEWISSWITYRPNVPVLCNSTTFFDMPYRMAAENPDHFAQYLLQAIARGGNPSTYMMGIPGKIPYTCFDVGSEITSFHKANRAVYDGLVPVAKTALVRPDRAQLTDKRYLEAREEFRGLYRSLTERHIPFDVLPLERLSAVNENGGLKRYNLLILSDLGYITQADADVFDRWVEAGGRLIATGSTAQGPGGVIQLKSLPSAKPRATVAKEELLFSTYIAPTQKERGVHNYKGPIIPLAGAYTFFEWKKGTEFRHTMLARAPFAPPEKAYGNMQVESPGAAIGNYGQGQAVVVPFTVGRAYKENGLTPSRDFFLSLVEEVGKPEDDVTIKIAEQVEVTVGKNGNKTIVHLLNQSGAKPKNWGPHLPIAGGVIEVRGGTNVRATGLKSGEKLDVEGGKIKLPVLDRYEVVVIETQ